MHRIDVGTIDPAMARKVTPPSLKLGPHSPHERR